MNLDIVCSFYYPEFLYAKTHKELSCKLYSANIALEANIGKTDSVGLNFFRGLDFINSIDVNDTTTPILPYNDPTVFSGHQGYYIEAAAKDIYILDLYSKHIIYNNTKSTTSLIPKITIEHRYANPTSIFGAIEISHGYHSNVSWNNDITMFHCISMNIGNTSLSQNDNDKMRYSISNSVGLKIYDIQLIYNHRLKLLDPISAKNNDRGIVEYQAIHFAIPLWDTDDASIDLAFTGFIDHKLSTHDIYGLQVGIWIKT